MKRKRRYELRQSQRTARLNPLSCSLASIVNRWTFLGIYLGRGRRLGLKCLLLSYFRVGDDTPGTPTISLEMSRRVIAVGPIDGRFRVADGTSVS